MPQEIYPYNVVTPDSIYVIESDEVFMALPDSIKQLVPVQYIPQQNQPYEVSPEFMIGALILFGIILFKAREALKQIELERIITERIEQKEAEYHAPQCLIYKGEELEFTTAEVHAVCSKYNSFYAKLNEEDQARFIERLGQFMYYKDFYIMSPKGFKEMPILVSAAAIQISFGLPEFHFTHFTRIIIHPEEYIAYEPLRILVGNVQGRSITLSWKHFLEDYENPADGKNVGLHEMAHALQVQYLFENYGYRSEFKNEYEHYDKIDDLVLQAERTKSSSLFDQNALSNANEFWATSVELFFEKPNQLKEVYPQLYNSISMVLNQDTAG